MTDKNKPYDPSTEGAQMSFDGRMSYGDYLQIDKILDAQHPLSEAHDEMLFIIQHQTSELWMRLAIHELQAARNAIKDNHLPPAFKMLSRVARIFEQLNNAWDVLRTMTPSEYTEFRNTLGQSSGFQSHQYRLVEYVLGNRNQAMLKPHAHKPDVHALLAAELELPSLYDEALHLLSRNGITIPCEVLDRDVSAQHMANDQVEMAWKTVYQSPEEYWSLYELAEKLVKRGTGGTGGVSYLRRMLEVELFPELWHVRTQL